MIISNSYDWDATFTHESLWFDDLTDEIDGHLWQLENELDNVPYVTPIYQRKAVIKYNHLQAFRKRPDRVLSSEAMVFRPGGL
jgi:hypothetical protein